MSGSSSTNSSWTLLAAEENVVEPLRSVVEGVEHHADTLDPATVETIGDMDDGKDAVSAERDRSEDSWQSPQEVDVDRMMDVISHEQHDPNLTPDPAHDPNLTLDPAHDPNVTPDPAHDPNVTPDPAHDPNLTPDPAHDPNVTPDPAHDPNLTPDPAHDPNLTPDPAHDPNLTSDTAHDPHMTPDPASVTNEHLSSSLGVPAHCNPDHDTASQLEGSSESQAPPTPDPDSFSESYTHISPSAEESADFLLPPETLGAEKHTEEEEELRQEGEAAHHLTGEGRGQEGEESELSQRVTEDRKQEGEESELSQRVTEDRKQEVPTVGEESGVRKRRGSLLAALERIGRQDEEEEEPEDFHLPQREEEIGFSLNKCILGAIILLGLGTIFFSGVFMDLDEEEEYDVRQMRDTELTRTQAWLNPDLPPPPVDVDNPELLSEASEGSLHETMLHAQLQAQKEQLKEALGAEERVRREEQEEEEGRMKTQAESLLLKENDQMKRELASVPALQREVETLRATVTQLKHRPASDAPPPAVSPSAAPPSGPGQDGSLNTASPAEEESRTTREGEGKEEKKKERKVGREWMKDEPEQGKQETGWKERGEKKQKDGEKKDWKLKKEKQEDGDVKGWKKRKEKKGWKEEKTEDWKKERESRGDDGKPWRNREDKKDGRRKDERKEWKKTEKEDERKEWKKSKKEKKGGKWQEDRKEGKDEGKKKEEWKHEKDWGEKRREEEKEWRSDKDWKKKGGVKKDGSREWKSKEKERPWQGREEERTRERDRKKGREEERIREGDRKKGREEERIREGDRKKEREEVSWRHEGEHKHKDQHQHKHDKREHRPHGFTEREGGKRERLWEGPGETSPPHTHRRPPLEQPNYWLLQRERLQRNPSPQTKCTSVEACAQAEGLLPVPLPEFEALLLGYLAKAEGVGVSASRMEELRLLATDFFRDGVFTHDQMSFRDFVEDLADILEDMVEGEEDEEDEEDEEEEEGGIEDEMEGFDDEALRRFAVPGGGEKVERKRGEKMKEAGRAGG